MFKKISILTLLISLMLKTALADYQFPTSTPPGGKDPSTLKQYVTFIWDDNGYSGLEGTIYEHSPDATTWQTASFIGGKDPEGNPKPNNDNLSPGMIGMSWASKTLAGIRSLPPLWEPKPLPPGTQVLYNDTIWETTAWSGETAPTDTATWEPWKKIGPADYSRIRENPDGSQIKFTFNVITGFFIPVIGQEWTSRESKYGYWQPKTEDKMQHYKVAIAWGREQMVKVNASDTDPYAGNYGFINKVFEDAYAQGHEIGNHTIDHMESNSPLSPPDGANSQFTVYKDGFGAWGGEGYDYSPLDTMPWGEVVNEAEMFGQEVGQSAQTMGWKVYAGRYLSQTAWQGAVALAEEELDEYLGISVAKGNLFGFRAPRLEVSSGLYFGLKELGYQYDCGLEEGYEMNVDGSNFLWPYTTDNGSPNVIYQRSIGERVSIDSMPAGLWQIPSNVFIVHPDHRQTTYNNHASINAAAPDGETIETYEEWVDGGAKITGYDFNMWILWGMTKTGWLESMKYTTQLRLDGNKAPIHYGAHTDYYTPIYDNATLQNKFNLSSYGQVVTNGWNTWQDRIEATEEYIDWAIANDCYFITGHDLIEEIKTMQSGETVGTAKSVTDAAWEFFKNEGISSSASQSSFVKDVTNASVTVGAAAGAEYPDCGYSFYEAAGFFEGLTHVELKYKTTTPIVLRLAMQNDNAWEVTLGNVGPEVNSGKIPLYAFHYNQYDTTGSKTSINTADIVGVELKLLTSGEEQENHTFTAKDFIFYGASGGQIANLDKIQSVLKQSMKIHAFNSNNLTLGLSKGGKLSVDIMTVNGKTVKTFKNREFKAGINNLNLGNISKGVYLINIRDNKGKKTFKNYVM